MHIKSDRHVRFLFYSDQISLVFINLETVSLFSLFIVIVGFINAKLIGNIDLNTVYRHGKIYIFSLNCY